MSLHDQIAGLAGKRKFEFTYEQEGYLAACKDAAQIAKEADEMMAEMVSILEDLPSIYAIDVLNRYEDFKESTK